MTGIPHFGFILASYLVSAAVLAGLVLWVVIDGHNQRVALDELERRGVRRHSAGPMRGAAR